MACEPPNAGGGGRTLTPCQGQRILNPSGDAEANPQPASDDELAIEGAAARPQRGQPDPAAPAPGTLADLLDRLDELPDADLQAALVAFAQESAARSARRASEGGRP